MIFSKLIREIFEAIGLDPALAQKRVKPSNVARGRALAVWLWVEIMGRPQVTVAEGLRLRPSTVSGILTNLRRDGITKEDARILKKVLASLTDAGDKVEIPVKTNPGVRKGPRVIVLKRTRR